MSWCVVVFLSLFSVGLHIEVSAVRSVPWHALNPGQAPGAMVHREV